MKISGFVRRSVVGVSPATSLRDAAKAMRGAGVSCLPVIRTGMVVGLIREHDLVKALAICRRPEEALVTHFMNSCVMAYEDDDLPDAVAKMLAVRCLHLPVLDHGRLLGMVSATELLAAEARLEGIAV